MATSSVTIRGPRVSLDAIEAACPFLGLQCECDYGDAAFASRHAPPGGAFVAGKHYPGGQYIPADVVARATPEEQAVLDRRAAPAPQNMSGTGAGRAWLDAASAYLDAPEGDPPHPPDDFHDRLNALAREMVDGTISISHGSPERVERISEASLSDFYGAVDAPVQELADAVDAASNAMSDLEYAVSLAPGWPDSAADSEARAAEIADLLNGEMYEDTPEDAESDAEIYNDELKEAGSPWRIGEDPETGEYVHFDEVAQLRDAARDALEGAREPLAGFAREFDAAVHGYLPDLAKGVSEALEEDVRGRVRQLNGPMYEDDHDGAESDAEINNEELAELDSPWRIEEQDGEWVYTDDWDSGDDGEEEDDVGYVPTGDEAAFAAPAYRWPWTRDRDDAAFGWDDGTPVRDPAKAKRGYKIYKGTGPDKGKRREQISPPGSGRPKKAGAAGETPAATPAPDVPTPAPQQADPAARVRALFEGGRVPTAGEVKALADSLAGGMTRDQIIAMRDSLGVKAGGSSKSALSERIIVMVGKKLAAEGAPAKPAKAPRESAAPKVPEPTPATSGAAGGPSVPDAMRAAAEAGLKLGLFDDDAERINDPSASMRDRMYALASMDVNAFDPIVTGPLAATAGITTNEILRPFSRLFRELEEAETGTYASEYAVRAARKNLSEEAAEKARGVREVVVPALRRLAERGVGGLRRYDGPRYDPNAFADFYEDHAAPLLEAIARDYAPAPEPDESAAPGAAKAKGGGEGAKADRHPVARKIDDLKARVADMSRDEVDAAVRDLGLGKMGKGELVALGKEVGANVTSRTSKKDAIDLIERVVLMAKEFSVGQIT